MGFLDVLAGVGDFVTDFIPGGQFIDDAAASLFDLAPDVQGPSTALVSRAPGGGALTAP